MKKEPTFRDKRKNGCDRRQSHAFPPLGYLLKGRRKKNRRESDKNGCYYTDCSHPVLPLLIIFILLMSVFDWGLTLLNLERGASEANPLMAMAISVGEHYFFMLKYAMTSVGLFILYLYKNFFPTPRIIFVIFLIYSSLILYHLFGFYFFS